MKRSKVIEKLKDHFQVGKIVDSYSGKDIVISFNELTKDNLHVGSDWSVTVAKVDDNGNVIGSERTHCTAPRFLIS